MKNELKLISIIIFCLAISLSSCAKEDIYRGIYETTTQEHEIKRDSSGTLIKDEPPTYEQYERDRREVTGKQDN